MIPPNFRLATGVSKFNGESKPDTWLEDYRVAVQIGGGNDEVAMKHLPLMLEGSARAWLNQLTPSNIYTCTTRNMSTSDLLSVTLEELVINL